MHLDWVPKTARNLAAAAAEFRRALRLNPHMRRPLLWDDTAPQANHAVPYPVPQSRRNHPKDPEVNITWAGAQIRRPHTEQSAFRRASS